MANNTLPLWRLNAESGRWLYYKPGLCVTYGPVAPTRHEAYLWGMPA